MAPHLWHDPSIFCLELLFTVIAVGLCAVIYRKTKDIYELTKYPGIGYFREAFLFLGISFVMRFLFGLILLSREVFDVMLPRQLFVPLSIIPLGYFSTAALVYLFFSSAWKRIASRFDLRKAILLGNLVAVGLPIIAFFTRSHHMLIWLQTALLVLGISSALLTEHKGRGLSQMRKLYFLMFGLWLLVLWTTDPSPHIPFPLTMLLDAASIAVLAVIYRKMMKWTR